LIKYGKHAREQMIERGISVKEIEGAIKMGARNCKNQIKYFTITGILLL